MILKYIWMSYEDTGVETENAIGEEPVDDLAKAEVDHDDSSSSESDDLFKDDLAWRDDVADDFGESESYGSYVVDTTDEDQELELNLTEEQATNRRRQISDTETEEEEEDRE